MGAAPGSTGGYGFSAHCRSTLRGLGLGSGTVIPDRKTADEPNDWTKYLLGHAGLRGRSPTP
jgi:hypothetical protein